MPSIDSLSVKKLIDSKINILDNQFNLNNIIDELTKSISDFYQKLLIKTSNLKNTAKTKNNCY